MWTLFTLLVLVGLAAYFMFFWSPGEAAVAARGHQQTAKRGCSAFQPQQRAPHLDFEKPWYGLTFRGYHDDYCVSTARTPDDAMRMVHLFFTSRKGKVVLEQGPRLLFSRGRKIYTYLGGADTWPTQEIEVMFQTENGFTRISIQYRVAGWHLRTPPNQLRREVLALHAELVGTVANGSPAMPIEKSKVTDSGYLEGHD